MNRKGDIAITLLVLMTLMLVGATLFIFLTRNAGFEAFVADARFVEGAYAKEVTADLYLQTSAENALAESYDSLSAWFKMSGFNDAATKSLVKNSFINNIRNEINKYNGDDEDIKSLKDLVNKESFDVDIGDGFVRLKMKDFVIRTTYVNKESKRVWVWKIIPTWIKEDEIKAMIGVSYKPEVSANINFTNFGVADFSEIYDAGMKCKSLGELELKRACLVESLPAFDVSVTKQGESSSVKLSTKRVFLIGNEIKKIEMGFLL